MAGMPPPPGRAPGVAGTAGEEPALPLPCPALPALPVALTLTLTAWHSQQIREESQRVKGKDKSLRQMGRAGRAAGWQEPRSPRQHQHRRPPRATTAEFTKGGRVAGAAAAASCAPVWLRQL